MGLDHTKMFFYNNFFHTGSSNLRVGIYYFDTLLVYLKTIFFFNFDIFRDQRKFWGVQQLKKSSRIFFYERQKLGKPITHEIAVTRVAAPGRGFSQGGNGKQPGAAAERRHLEDGCARDIRAVWQPFNVEWQPWHTRHCHEVTIHLSR